MALSHRQSQLELIVNSQPPQDGSEAPSEDDVRGKEPESADDAGDHGGKEPENEGEGNQVLWHQHAHYTRTTSSFSMSGKEVVRDSL